MINNKVNQVTEITRCRFMGSSGFIKETAMCLVSGDRIVKKLTEDIQVYEVIRCADPTEDFALVKLIYSVGYAMGDCYMAIMPFRDFLNCQYTKYCKHIARYFECSNSEFNRVLDYAVKFAAYKKEELSFEEVDKLTANTGTSPLKYLH